MATLLELGTLKNESGYGDFLTKVRAAAVKKAQVIADDGSATATQQAWAKTALGNPGGTAKVVLPYIVAKNDSVTVAQILSASDTAIQSNVDDAVDNLFGA